MSLITPALPLPSIATAAAPVTSLFAPRANPLRRPLPLRCAPIVGDTHPSRSPFRFSDASVSLSVLLGFLPPDFHGRWRYLLKISENAEAKIEELPYHLIHAVTASEDLRFFYHDGVDPFGIARAVTGFPNSGGGSTITQQVVKRIFLTSERKASRKFVEWVISLIVEKKISKLKILHSYLATIYWGHGMYGVKAASLFYFGKHPSLLTMGESTLLAGILPAPEIFSPFINPSRGKTSQTRVLRRMVAAGFLDMETALYVAKQPLCLHTET